MNNILSHISFIMDGNHRWSKKNDETKFHSYKKGAGKLLSLSKYLFETYDIKYISAFALSIHNLKRSKEIINTIIDVLKFYLNKENIKNYDNFFDIEIRGNVNFIPDRLLKKKIKELNSKKKNKKKLIIFINYGGQNDILNAYKNIIKNKQSLNYRNFKMNLMTHDLPDPDLLVRTGGFQRLSDFMLFQISFTELYFVKKLWPDLLINDLRKIINNYNSIERKFGI